jgi:hypothetical protein
MRTAMPAKQGPVTEGCAGLPPGALPGGVTCIDSEQEYRFLNNDPEEAHVYFALRLQSPLPFSFLL